MFQGGDFGIMHLRRSDSGEYECTATYVDGQEGILERDSLKVQLNVQCMVVGIQELGKKVPVSDKAEISPKTRRFYTVLAGAKIDLNCVIEANPMPTKVKWTKNGRELNNHWEKPVGGMGGLIS